MPSEIEEGMNSPQQEVWALVCQGGGGKGAWEAGFIYEACEHFRADFKTCIGTSVGALNCALYLQCVAAGNFRVLQDAWLATGAFDILSLNRTIREVFRLGIVSGHSKLLSLIRRYVRSSDIERVCSSNQKYFYTMATCVDDLRHWTWHPFCFVPTNPARLTSHDGFSSLYAALLASAAIPLAYPYVQQDTMMLYDGGLVDNNPLSHALQTGCTKILVLTPIPLSELQEPGWISRAVNPLLFLENQVLRRLRRAQDWFANWNNPNPPPTVYFVTPSKHLPSGTLWFTRQSSSASFCMGRADAERFYSNLQYPPAALLCDLANIELPQPKVGLFEKIFQLFGCTASSS